MADVAETESEDALWPEEMRGLPERVRHARKRLRMTKVALAELSGIDPTTIGRIEKGKRRVTFEALFALARVLKVPPEWLLLGKGTLPEAEPPIPGTTDQRFRVAADAAPDSDDFAAADGESELAKLTK